MFARFLKQLFLGLCNANAWTDFIESNIRTKFAFCVILVEEKRASRIFLAFFDKVNVYGKDESQ